MEGDLDVTSSSSEDEYCEDQSQLFRYSQWANNSNIYGLDLKSTPRDVDIYQRFVRDVSHKIERDVINSNFYGMRTCMSGMRKVFCCKKSIISYLRQAQLK